MRSPAWEIPVSPHDPLVGPFRSDLRALEILRDRGITETGIDIIQGQIAELSSGYRNPEKKLADVLEGGAVLQDDMVLLLHGFGGIERGNGSGDCSESVRALTSAWAKSSMHRHLAKAGLHPFYLEVAAPRLFPAVWDNGSRIRSGHVVVALGSPEEYLFDRSDESFIIIDPSLGLVQPMNTSTYIQTGFTVTPELEQRPQFVPLLFPTNEAESQKKFDGVSSLVLGTDKETRFVYSLRIAEVGGYIVPQLAVTDGTKVLVSFDPSQARLLMNEQGEKLPDQAMYEFMKLTDILMQNPLRIFNDAHLEDDFIVAGGNKIKMIRELAYPRPPKMALSIAGMEAAATMAMATGKHFSLVN